MKRYLQIAVILFGSFLCSGQPYQENLNVHNGLLSNHVYYSMVDKYGYLWLATLNGVIKYNGYTFKVFGLAAGLPNNDVWFLYEDNKDRIWPISISYSIGYIRNDEYKRLFIKENDSRIYPTNIINTDSGIAFGNLCGRNNKYVESCFEKNDTLYSYPIYGSQYNSCLISPDEGIVAATDSAYYTCNNANHTLTQCCCNATALPGVLPRKLYLYRHYILSYTSEFVGFQKSDENIWVTDLRNGIVRKLDFDKDKTEHIVVMFPLKEKHCIATNKGIYLYDTSLNLIKKINTANIAGKETRSDITSYLEDTLWGKCYATANSGYYIHFDTNEGFKRRALPLQGYSHCGNDANGNHYWWNKRINTLMCIDTANKITHKVFHDFSNITCIIPFTKQKSLLLAENDLFLLSAELKKVEHYLKDSNKHVTGLNQMVSNAADAKIINGDLYILFREIFVKTIQRGFTRIDLNKYKKIVYDSIDHCLWLNADNKILVYNIQNGQKNYITREFLNEHHIYKLEQLLIDNKYGNVFLGDYNHLYHFDYHTGKLTELFQNYVLNNASYFINNDQIIICCKAGVLFAQIEGKGIFSEPLLRENTKELIYSNICDIQVSDKDVLLNTDNGLFSTTFPTTADSKNAAAKLVSYNIIAKYQNKSKLISANDTVILSQPSGIMYFDIINPRGIGTPLFSYKTESDSSWCNMEQNCVHLDSFIPGRYYRVFIQVRDDIWKSKTMALFIYIKPFWWQTAIGRFCIWAIAFLFLATLSILSFILMRKAEKQKNLELTSRLSLELKSLYSQLNPHFIFNSLNFTQYLISAQKTEEAYTHISKFSSLLRSYLKSSRARLIPINEEVENLKQYIELQQIRFNNSFFYEIVVGQNIGQSSTLLPAMLIQPLVENAINHGILPKNSDDGFVRIEFYQNEGEDSIMIVIEDNGIGRSASELLRSKQVDRVNSYGTSLTNELIHIFNVYEKTGISISYLDKSYPLTGLIVKIEIKNPDSNVN